MITLGCRFGVGVAFFIAVLFGQIASPAVGQTKRFIEIEIASSRREPLETQQRWLELLKDVGADRVRSRSTRLNAKIKVTETESFGTVRVKILGAIDNQKLVLPGKTFALRDKTALAEYVENLRADGADVALAEKQAFGLTAKQLVDVNTELSKKLSDETRGQSVGDIVNRISGAIQMKISISSKAKKIIKQADPVRNEFQGYSSGTSLAGVLDPLGIVAVPRRNGETITIDLVVQDQADEFWPIGWPAKKVPVKTVPRLFDRAPIEIRDFPLNQVLTAIASAADAAMIFDYRAIEDKKIDMEKTNVTVVKETSYARALEKALSQVRPRMKYEIKLDENNKPFLWVTAW